MTLAPCARRSHLLTIARAAKIGATKIRHLCGHCATIFPKRNGRQPQRTHVDWLPLVGPVVHCAAPLQLHASVLSGKPPVGFGMLFVAVGLPGLDLFLQRLLIRDLPAKLVQGHTLSLRTTNHRKGDLGVRLRYISQYLSCGLDVKLCYSVSPTALLRYRRYGRAIYWIPSQLSFMCSR